MVDVSVVCSCAPSYVGKCALKPAFAIRERVRKKTSHYTQLASDTGFSLVPVVFDALGVPCRETIDMIRDMASRSGLAPVG